MDLFGRQLEQAAMSRVVAGAMSGQGAALVLWGDPGIGKTALLEHATDVAGPGFTILTCRGTRLESGLAFAGLHQLLWPVVDRIDTLPLPQARALKGALGHSGDQADRFLLGAAVLTLLSDLAEVRPVLVVVDDGQWLDEPTAQRMSFVTRRVQAEPVAVLVAVHEDPALGDWELVPSLEVRGLDDSAARLLASSAARDVDDVLIEHTVRVAGGNPLALQELPRTLGETGAALLSQGDPVAVGPRLRRAFRARIDPLGSAIRTALLLAAADDRGEGAVLRRAGAVLGVEAEAWELALRSGLLTARGDRLRLRHSLIRAVVYEEATLADRQAVHRALAESLTADATGELRAWHLAAAAEKADEQVALLLERSAERAWGRGGCAAAVRALRRAAALSPENGDAVRRLCRGAAAAWDAGQVATARELLRASEKMSSEAAVARLSGGLRGVIEFARGDQERAHGFLLLDMREVPDPAKALDLGCLAVRAGWAAGRPELQAEALRQVGELARRRPFPDADLLPVLRAWWTTEPGEDAKPGPAVLTGDVLARLSSSLLRLHPPTPLGVAWGLEQPLSVALRNKIAKVRRTEEVGVLTLALAQSATLDIVLGRWSEATANATEGMRVAEEIGADHLASQCRNCLALLAAMRGDEETVAAAAARTLELSVPREVRALSAAAHWYLGMSALFAGRADEALERLLRLTEPGHDAAHPTFAVLAVLDTVEAALRAGRPEAAEPQTQLLRRWADHTEAAWAVSGAHLARALLADASDAEKWFQFALEVPGASSRPFSFARTRLLYGEWLRRARRRSEARVQLAEAAEAFQRLGATPLLERAQAEQELTGAHPHRSARGSERQDVLTPQELRVARLAGEGLTNREIAAQLLISPRTVGHHLSNVFPKLGIISRSDLAKVDFDGAAGAPTDTVTDSGSRDSS
ncbi:AAA family ATPase [Lentzea sp. JNUCC 0626]|uniref:AAA family ATPase n=1 Tax=Lentzea sp. JNUCC 0626 TaxID=3367513 RepID=UPI00374A272A